MFFQRLSSLTELQPTPLFAGRSSSFVVGRPLLTLQIVVVEREVVVASEPVTEEMRLAVVFEHVVKETGLAVVLEHVAEEMGMQPCLALHRRRPRQNYGQVVNG